MEHIDESSPLYFYRNKQNECTVGIAEISRRIYGVGTARIALALFFIAWLIWSWDWFPVTIVWIIAAISVVAFLCLVKVHSRLFAKKAYLEAVLEICRKEFRLSRHDFTGCDTGEDFFDAAHDYTADLDIFGNKSLFSYVDRTSTAVGRQRLVDWLRRPLAGVDAIHSRQEAVRELAGLTELRLHFCAEGMVSGERVDDAATAGSNLSGKIFSRSRWAIFTINALPYVYVVLALATLAWPVAGPIIGLLFCLCFLFSLFIAQRVTLTQQRLEKGLHSIGKYERLIAALESERFESVALQELVSAMQPVGGEKASVCLRRLRRYIDNLNQRNNAIAFLFLNGFLLWDCRQLLSLDRWVLRHAEEVLRWLDAIARFDALSSLAAFSYNHPDYVFPSVVDTDKPVYRARGLGHPLIDSARCVRNDVDMPCRPSFLIITGANMAGKSTYLRTIGVNFVLASVGAPVCADEMTFTPCTLFTGLHTTDSLAGNESYFFAELKRLQQVVVRQRAGEKCFVILDEILKGTNSVDKQKGSIALVRQLIALGAAGVAATHDLVLGSLADEYPGTVAAVCFESEIIDDELHFDYRLREGVARHMNACFLMEQMDIIPRSEEKNIEVPIDPAE